MEFLVRYLETIESESNYEERLKGGIDILRKHLKDYQTIKNTNETKHLLATKFPEYSEFTEGIISIENNSIIDDDEDEICIVNYYIIIMYRGKEISISGFTANGYTSLEHLVIVVQIDEYDYTIWDGKINQEDLQNVFNLIDIPEKNFIPYVQFMFGYR